MNEQLVKWLFETKAIRVCPADEPFWYTSGKIGPYYVNTHFLYGSEEKANALLALIDMLKSDKMGCTAAIEEAVLENERTDAIFRGTIDAMADCVAQNLPMDEISCISGGERRDWFFSLPLARRLNLPHVTIFKDMDAVWYDNGASGPVPALNGRKVLHVADLITSASSYERAWVPAIRSMGGEMAWSLVAVDRLQGGEETLTRLGVRSLALTEVAEEAFVLACDAGLIDVGQLEMIRGYISEPDKSMESFLRAHPEFLRKALAGGAKSAERAQLLLSQNHYGAGDWFKG